MKKKLTRAMAIALIAMMLVPAFAALPVKALENTPADQIVNYYDPATATKDAQPDPSNNGKTIAKTGELASATIPVAKGTAVQTGDTIYVGPCTKDDKKLDWTFAFYKKAVGTAESYPASKKTYELASSNIVENGTFMDGSVIYAIKIPAGTKAVALRALSTHFEHMLITVNQPFDIDGYFAYADAQGWDLSESGLRPVPPKFAEEAPEGYEGLWNLFPREGERDPLIHQNVNDISIFTQNKATAYVLSDYIPVTEGDTICLGAIKASETVDILYGFDANLNQTKTSKVSTLTFKEDIGYGYAIYTYTVPADVTAIKVNVHIGIYNDGDVLVTRNQPFTGAELRATLGIADLSEDAKAHAFYGKEALFIGDSISYGSFDTPPSYRNPSASWARRLAQATGLIPTNISYPGASVGDTGNKNIKWAYDLLKQQMRLSIKEFDMVVFQGGVNDARQDVAVGEALPADTDYKILSSSERTQTFAGGLQLMFHDAKTKWPNAELYFVATFKLVPDSVKGKDMNEYYEQAKILCAEYGVHYIDLYDDVELYETFDIESTDVLPDLIHPESPAYDTLFPTILRLFNATISVTDDNENENENENNEVVTPETPNNSGSSDTANDANNAVVQPVAAFLTSPVGIAAIVAALVVIVLVVVLIVKKAKANNQNDEDEEDVVDDEEETEE